LLVLVYGCAALRFFVLLLSRLFITFFFTAAGGIHSLSRLIILETLEVVQHGLGCIGMQVYGESAWDGENREE